MKFLDPRVDIAFKKLFGSEDHKNVTIAFINTILEYTGDKLIKKIQFMNNEQLPMGQEKKENILDILCTDQANRQYIIEMQNAWEPGFAKRIQWYGAKTYANQLQAAKPYHDLDPVVVIAITRNFNVFPHKKAHKSIHHIVDSKTGEHDLKDLTFGFVELLKFKKQEHELVTNEDKWLFLLKEIGTYDHIPAPLNHEEFQKACEVLNRMTWSDNAYVLYEKTMIKAQSEAETGRLLLQAKQKIQAAEEEGLQKGLEKGLQEGEKKIVKIVQAMLEKGLDVESIASITGLSVDKIKEIQEQE